MSQTPKATLRLAIVQMTATNRYEGNIACAERVVAEAAAAGAELIAFPEVAGMMNRRLEADRALIQEAGNDPWINACRSLAEAHRLWIQTGSTPVITTGDSRFRNHASLIDDRGRVVASYDKVHLFDTYPEDGKPILESKRFAAGQYASMPLTPWGPVGLSICYDLRFPHFYRDYAQDGAGIFFIPSAFTVPTGKAHWEILLRARAIENGAFVIAAAQTGHHDDGRETWGHGMVVDPWGRVLVDQGREPGVAIVDLDLDAVKKARSRIPSLANERRYSRRKTGRVD